MIQKLLLHIKIIALKAFCAVAIIGDKNVDVPERIENFAKSAVLLGSAGFISNIFTDWYVTNQKFTWAVMVVILANAVFGGWMHFKKGKFDWEDLLIKTIRMLLVVWLTYLTLELIISFAGTGTIINGVRAALQVSTLLYPGTKILKNAFILSKGEYPPEWVMKRIYNFNSNGDLKEFLKPEKKESENED